MSRVSFFPLLPHLLDITYWLLSFPGVTDCLKMSLRKMLGARASHSIWASEGFREPWRHHLWPPSEHILLLLFRFGFRTSIWPYPSQTPHLSLPPSCSFRSGFMCSLACQVQLMLNGLVGLTLYRTYTGNHGYRVSTSATRTLGSTPPCPPALSFYLLYWGIHEPRWGGDWHRHPT